MADLLSHLIVGYTIGTVLSWRYEKIKTAHVTAIMLGTVIPDLVRMRLLIDPVLIENALRIPFSWSPIHTLGGVLALSVLTLFLTEQRYSKIVPFLVFIGGTTHLFLDFFLRTASGYSYGVLWPFLDLRLLSPGLYVSPDIWPALIALPAGIIIWIFDAYR